MRRAIFGLPSESEDDQRRGWREWRATTSGVEAQDFQWYSETDVVVEFPQ